MKTTKVSRFQVELGCRSLLALALVAVVAAGCQMGARSQKETEPAGNAPTAITPNDSGSMMLDLAPFQNSLETLVGETYMFKTVTGRQTFDGLPFEVDGQAILFGQSFLNNRGTDYPESLTGIRVGRKFDELHLIHYCAWLDADGTPLARIRLNYADGSKYEFAILYGAQVRDWFQQPTEEREPVSDPDTKICWRSTGTNSPTGGLRLFKSMIRNPYPQKVVTTLDVISTRSLGSYVLVAATVAAYDPSRPVTPPIPWIKPQNYDGSVAVHVLDKVTGQPIGDAVAITTLGIDDFQNWAAPFHTSPGGTGIMRYPITRTKFLWVSVHKQGYEGRVVRWQGERIPDEYTIRLTPVSGKIGGLVLDEKGEPVANAGIRVQDYNFSPSDAESTSLGNLFTRADASGHWSIQGLPEGYQDFGVIATHPDYPQAQFLADGPVERGITGKHISTADFFAGKAVLHLQPWGRLEGVVLNHGKPMSGQELFIFAGDAAQQINVWGQEPVTTDAQGRFTFAHVPPGNVRIELKQPMTERSWTYMQLQSEDVKPGGTNMVQINFNGRPVIGHLKYAAGLTNLDLNQCSIALQPDVKPPTIPKEISGDQEKVQKWYQDWMKTDSGKKYTEAVRKQRRASVKPDGAFRMEAVEPGKYNFAGALWQDGAMQAQVDAMEVTVPDASANDPDAPFDIGEVTLKAAKHVNKGDMAPDFSVKTLDGKPLKLSDFRGKYVLLDFWATWCGPCVAETPNLKATYDAFGKEPRFVMISLSLDTSVSAPKKFAEDRNIQWTQGFLGNWSDDHVTKDYGVYGIPSILLIGPDGKIIAQNLREARIKEAVASALNVR